MGNFSKFSFFFLLKLTLEYIDTFLAPVSSSDAAYKDAKQTQLKDINTSLPFVSSFL